MSDRRYRYYVTQRSGGWHAFIGGMATDDLEPVNRHGVQVLFKTEALALRGALDVLLRKIQQDIIAHREAIEAIGLKRPDPLVELSKVFSPPDAERVYHKPGRSVPVVRKRRKLTNANA